MVASLLNWSGMLDAAGGLLAPAMAVFALPADAAMPTALAAVRKDGILLLAEAGTVASLSATQLLVATFLAGTVLPCLVTVITIGRELGLTVRGQACRAAVSLRRRGRRHRRLGLSRVRRVTIDITLCRNAWA